MPATSQVDTSEEKPFAPRDTLNEVLKNLHGSLKWFWQLIMGLSMARAVDTLIDAYIRGTIQEKGSAALAILSFVLVFIPTFLRFYFGDSRYLDEHYLEYRKWRPLKEYLTLTQAKVSLTRFSLDVILLFAIGILFIFMARALILPEWFFLAWWILLVFNVMWLGMTIILNNRFERTPISAQSRYGAPYKWIANNTIHIILFALPLYWASHSPPIYWFEAPISYPGVTLQQTILLAIALSNSIFDFVLTGDYYVPRLNIEFHEVLTQPGDSSSDTPTAVNTPH